MSSIRLNRTIDFSRWCAGLADAESEHGKTNKTNKLGEQANGHGECGRNICVSVEIKVAIAPNHSTELAGRRYIQRPHTKALTLMHIGSGTQMLFLLFFTELLFIRMLIQRHKYGVLGIYSGTMSLHHYSANRACFHTMQRTAPPRTLCECTWWPLCHKK